MSSLTNVNNNAAVVVVGRTAPVPPGQQIASKSLPVVIASDQPAIPVEEQNKIASEVALSLLGIPRSEVALGIFADVNTYDVNPSEWASTPEQRESYPSNTDEYNGFAGTQNHGLQHIPEESGALIEAPANKTATLTSKRFFRYQPGRVSAATFGVKTSVIPAASSSKHVRNPCVRKYGIFDNFDGYYWETRDTGTGDFLSVVRRTQSIIESNPLTYGSEQTEDFGTAGNPSTSTAGDLCILRDGLIHTHAAMYDPSMLLEETEYEFTGVSTGTVTVASTTGLNEGQHVIYETQETSALGNLLHSRVYKILNLTGTTFELTELDNDTKIIVGALSGTHKIKTPAPFVFPDTSSNAGAEDVMFPYRRSFSNEFATLGTPVGAIATDTPDAYAHPGTFDGDGDSNADIIQQIKKVNSGVSCALLPVNGTASQDTSGWENFIAWNVKPEFYKVYEYRIPRSRFSGDFVDGNEDRNVFYSDLVRTGGGDDTIKYPGQNVKTVADPDANEIRDSIWNIDFTKVLMQKIEFSWYGAVGALFLAYVPVSNGEARWVRIHHLRASNQLKVASLGNATLPITYTVYGGGSTNMYGYNNTERQQNSIPGSGSYSQYITKYGASYYIDGGDRGTVRLHSYSTDAAADVYGSKYTSSNWSAGTSGGYGYVEISAANASSDGFPAISDYYMKARVVSNNAADRGVFVQWVQLNGGGSGVHRLILNKPLVGTSGIGVIADRPQLVFGLQTKQNIVSSQNQAVRNRVQVYPTRLATGVSGSGTVALQLLKNPTFQSYAVDDWSGSLTIHATDITLQPAGQPTTLTTSATPTGLTAGDRIYGWFRCHFDSSVDANETLFPVLGYVTVLASGFTFTSLESFSSTVYIDASETFLQAGNYDEDGTALAAASAVSTFEIERLSSVVINPELRTPIPGTGTQITTFFVGAGGQQFDLLPYFDYNKDYLSFPLTNEVDTLFLASSSVAAYNSGSAEASVLASLTWEEQ